MFSRATVVNDWDWGLVRGKPHIYCLLFGLLKPRGRYGTAGGHTLRLLQTFCTAPLISRFSGKQVRIVALEPNRDLEYINDLFESKGLRLVIDGPYSLSDVPQAVKRFGEAKHVGKVVISVVPSKPGTVLAA